MAKAIYKLDPNHLGVRVSILIAMVAGFFAGILGIPALFRLFRLEGDLWSLLVLPGGIGIASGLAWLTEYVLRRVWPSGRVLELDEEHITLREPGGEMVQINWREPIDVWSWSFVVSERRVWVPRGWYCVAIRLVQGRNTIIPYTFVSPAQAQTLPAWQAFEELISQKLASRPGQEHLAQFLSQQEHLRAAEAERWRDGVEMQPQDFAAMVREIADRLDYWPPGGPM